jgi:hypothetical protein
MPQFGNIPAERAAIESTYEGLATVYEMQNVKDPGNPEDAATTGYDVGSRAVRTLSNLLPASTQTVTVNQVDYDAKLFISPDVTINPGSRITVVQNGMVFEGEQAGKPFRYPTHQEIKLKEILNA